MAIKSDGISKEIKYKNETLFLTRIQKYKDFMVGISTSDRMYKIDLHNNISDFELPSRIAKEKFSRFFIRNNYCYLLSANSVYELHLDSKKYQKVMSLSIDIEVTDVLLKNNTLFFATSKGIVIKNRAQLESFPKPKLFIENINVAGKFLDVTNLRILNPNENDVTINFSVLSFVPNVKYTVSYKINNSRWKTLENTDKSLNLSLLSSGKYTINFAINYNENKVDFQTIQFEIEKPWWLKTYFLFLVGFIFIGFIYLIYKIQIKKIHLRNKLVLEKVNLEKDVNYSKLKAIKSQMNPHFFYNALNTIQSFILSNDKKQAVSFLSKFSTLTRTILEMTEKETISIADEIKTLSLYLDIEKARFDEGFCYQITIDQNINKENSVIPAMLLQPYVENAIKYGLLHKIGEKKVIIEFKKQVNTLLIIIDDNGIGRIKSSELNAIKNKNHLSFATQATQNRIELLNKYNKKNIQITYKDKFNLNKQATGTSVIFEIPLMWNE